MKKNTLMAVLLTAILIAEPGSRLFAQNPGAANPMTLTLDQAVSLALENNIQLQSAAVDVRMKKRARDNAWNVFIPNIQATGTLARTNMGTVDQTLAYLNPITMQPESASFSIDLEEADRWRAIAGLNISLNINLALFEGLKATRQNYESGIIDWNKAQKQTEQNVKKAFYGLLLQEESLALMRDKLVTAEKRLEQTSVNWKNGLVPELAYLQAQLGVETQKPQIMEAELSLVQQRSLFAFLLGLPVGTEVQLSGSIEPAILEVDADQLIREHMHNRFDLASLRKNIELVNTQLRATQLQRYTPSISLSQSFSPTLGNIRDNWLQSDNWKDSSGAFSLTLAFNISNLLPFSSSSIGLKDTRDNLQKLDLATKLTLHNAELEIRNLVKKLDKNRASLSVMEMNVAIAEKAYRLTEQGYRAGTIEYLDLKDAENTMMQAKIGMLSERFNYLSTVLDLESALNTKLTGAHK